MEVWWQTKQFWTTVICETLGATGQESPPVCPDNQGLPWKSHEQWGEVNVDGVKVEALAHEKQAAGEAALAQMCHMPKVSGQAVSSTAYATPSSILSQGVTILLQH